MTLKQYTESLDGKWPTEGFLYQHDQQPFSHPDASRNIAYAMQKDLGVKTLHRDDVRLVIGKMFTHILDRVHTRHDRRDTFWHDIKLILPWACGANYVTPKMIEELANHIMLARQRWKRHGPAISAEECGGTALMVELYIEALKERRFHRYIPVLEDRNVEASDQSSASVIAVTNHTGVASTTAISSPSAPSSTTKRKASNNDDPAKSNSDNWTMSTESEFQAFGLDLLGRVVIPQKQKPSDGRPGDVAIAEKYKLGHRNDKENKDQARVKEDLSCLGKGFGR